MKAYIVQSGELNKHGRQQYDIQATYLSKEKALEHAQKIVNELYTGPALHLELMSAGFALSFYYVKPLNVVALFSGFILVHVTGLIVLARVTRG
jgi:ATP synthase protein I